MKKVFKWEAFAKGNRHAMINKIQTVIMNHDGFIINFNRFSDLALNIQVEIEEKKIPAFHKGLAGITELSELVSDQLNPDSKKECSLFLNITFKSGSGNLEIETDKNAI